MKIVIPSNSPDMEGMVAPKLGTAPYVLIIETDDMSFEVKGGPPQSSGSGAGVAVISLAVSLKAEALIVGYVAPHIVNAMKKQSIDIVTGVSGPVCEVVLAYLESRQNKSYAILGDKSVTKQVAKFDLWGDSFKKGLRQFYTMLPRLIGVILLLGLFKGFVSQQDLLSLFSGSYIKDVLLGGGLGSVLVGNPINSYVIGESLLSSGVAQAGVLALMMNWVNVGVIQLPIEAQALGWRFAIVRSVTSFTVAVFLSLLFAIWQGGVL